MRVAFTRISSNAKTGPIPVTVTESKSCPSNCKLKRQGCYAELGMVGMHWRKLDKGISGAGYWQAMQSIASLPKGQLWRHNVAGDLVHVNQRIASDSLAGIIQANKGKQGFTYTHHKVIGDDAIALHNQQQIRMANRNGFTINLSADSLDQADKLKALGIGPVVTILPIDSPKTLQTPEGNYVVVCPAVYRNDTTCASCGICQVSARKVIIGFPAHGAGKKKAEKVFMLKKVE